MSTSSHLVIRDEDTWRDDGKRCCKSRYRINEVSDVSLPGND
jgi:hypothetical protein